MEPHSPNTVSDAAAAQLNAAEKQMAASRMLALGVPPSMAAAAADAVGAPPPEAPPPRQPALIKEGSALEKIINSLECVTGVDLDHDGTIGGTGAGRI